MFSGSPQLSIKFLLKIKTKMPNQYVVFIIQLPNVEFIPLINVQMPTIVDGLEWTYRRWRNTGRVGAIFDALELAFRRWRNQSAVGGMIDGLEWTCWRWRNTRRVGDKLDGLELVKHKCSQYYGCHLSMDWSSLLLFHKPRCRDYFGSEFCERKYHVPSNLTGNNIQLARWFNKILCLITFHCLIFLIQADFSGTLDKK